ncbi:hypothetical protein [Bacillus sp. FJAT-45037]|uniref:hypothetical protein n=1 Tax=Bacillus sp. FJAT-45037 TaxID=2011007 RepID=UPI000C242034|nr:hypothetical protein [Bacillus sp. FJAT-45037]
MESAINATTIEVTFEGADEAVEIELEAALVHGENEVTFEYNGKEFTVTVDFVDESVVAIEEATSAVEAYEAATISTFAYVAPTTELHEAAQEAVDALENEEAQTELQERIDAKVAAVEAQLVAVVKSVNDATNQVQLLSSLNGFFLEVDSARVADYMTLKNSVEPTTVEEIQVDVVYTTNVESAVNASRTQVQLLAALENGQALGVFTGVRADYIVTYADTLIADGSSFTRTQIQEVINTATETIVETAESAVSDAERTPYSDVALANAVAKVAEVPSDLVDEDGENILAGFEARLADVKKVNEVLAGAKVSQLRLLAALNNNGFGRVNVDKISDYSTAIVGFGETPENLTVEDIQAEIDATNFEVAEETIGLLNNSSSNTDFANALALLDFVVADGEDETVKADLKVSYDEKKALSSAAKLTGASTNAAITSALQALSSSSEDFDFATVTTAYLNKYADKIAEAAGVEGATLNTITAGNIQTIVVGVAVTEVATLTEASTDPQVLAALTALAKATEDFDIDTVNTLLLSDYASAIDTDGVVKDTASDIQNIINGENNAEIVLDNIAGFTADENAPELLVLLKNNVLNLSNIVDANSAAYFANVSTIKTAAEVDVDGPAATTEEVATAKANLQAEINAVNAVVSLDAATTASAARTALTSFALVTANSSEPGEGEEDTDAATNYINLTNAAKLEVAELVLAERTSDGFKTVGTVTTELGDQIDARKALMDGVNTASTISAMSSALDALEYASFEALSSAEKLEVSEAFLAAFPMTTGEDPEKIKYTTLAGIKAAVDAAIASTN